MIKNILETNELFFLCPCLVTVCALTTLALFSEWSTSLFFMLQLLVGTRLHYAPSFLCSSDRHRCTELVAKRTRKGSIQEKKSESVFLLVAFVFITSIDLWEQWHVCKCTECTSPNTWSLLFSLLQGMKTGNSGVCSRVDPNQLCAHITVSCYHCFQQNWP